jgi:gliding motility-associated-like protein
LWSDESTNHLDLISEFGNYTVTVTDMCGKSIQANFNILAPDTLVIDLPDSLGVCPSGSVDYTAQAVGGIDPYSYAWSVGGAGNEITFTAADSGYVFVTAVDDCNKIASDSMKIYLPEPFSVDPILEICLDDNGLIAPHGGSYPLSFDYDQELLTSAVGGVYVGKKVGSDYVVVTDACGEMDSTLVSVVICNTQFYDIISPNGDGKNDTFEIVGIDHFQRSELTIWNRWGSEVYHSMSYANTWAAQESSDGTYFWQLLRSDGKKFSGIVTVVDSTKK